MEETNKQPDKAEVPMLLIRDGNTTFLIGIHFNQSSKETLDDKVKKLIRDEVPTIVNIYDILTDY